MIAEGCVRKNVRHQFISTVCPPSISGNRGETKMLGQIWCLLDRILASCLALLLSCDAGVSEGNHAYLKTSSCFPCKSRRYTHSGMKTLLLRRPDVLMLLPPLTLQRSDCSTEVVHSSNSLSMFNSSSFKCFLVPRHCFNFHHPDADGCRTGPVEHFNDPQMLKSQASYLGCSHLNNHCHQFPGNVMRQCKVIAH